MSCDCRDMRYCKHEAQASVSRSATHSLALRACIAMVLLFGMTIGNVCGADIDFNRDVRPILADNCFECHGPDVESREADLRLDVLDHGLTSVIVPGKPEESMLIERLLSNDPDEVMPPPEAKRRPTAKQIEKLRKWIEQGASYEPHWAFVAPARPTIPQVSQPNWVRNPIDSFVLAHLDSQSLTPQPEADPRVLARRLSLALTGLPVLPQRSDQFVEAYKADAERAISQFVDELLASDAYGEHWAWGWLDAARYADTNGYQADGYRVMWPWRDWLVGSLNANVPFDQLTELMLAGDLLLPKDQQDWQSGDWIMDDRSSDLLIATGFLRNHRYDTGSGTIPDESKFENAADRMETVATVWMGLTMLCARCHTHKYDPIENREYYELLSFFDNVPEIGSALKGASHPYIHVPTSEQQKKLKRLARVVHDIETKLSAARDQIDDAQTAWEMTLSDEEKSPLRVSRGLKFRFAEEPIHFDGTFSIEKTNDPALLCAGNQRWTISFWFRADSEENGAIFSSVEEPERYRPGIQADWVDGHVRVRHVCRWVNSYIEFRSKEKLAPGRWHHVTFRCDGRMQGLAYRASLDGLDDAMVCTHPVTNDSAEKAGKAPLVLGGSPLLAGFRGSLRDLRFYARELESAEVRSLADPSSTVDLARILPEERTEVESETLRLAFLESDDLPERVRLLQNEYFAAVERLADAVRETPTTMVMKDAQTPHTRIRIAGVYDSLGEKVDTDTPKFLPPLPEGDRNRLRLARWLTRPDHPLTARVAVNRVWQTLWGRGFVDSPENFGTQCAEPIHADLLDWLATEYVRLGWDTKALIRLIVTSRAYRQSSDAPDSMWKLDPDNRHLARGPRFRLPVSVVRDQALFLSGRLDSTIGGPPVVLDDVRGKDGKPMKVPFQKADNRRTLYSFWKRNSPHPMLAVFDVADRNQCEVRTLRTNTPLQALVTLNEAGFARCAEALGERARQVGQASSLSEFDSASRMLTPLEQQLHWVWLACTGRDPDDEDMHYLTKTLRDYRNISGDEDRAWTALSNVLLNLDATLTLE
ncbi:MAG: DUF1553 domain-containing protein [Planctomycetota bacterium]|nr:MAG: DUF1553 domain-containing protein [Planctomycetota bacterium]